MVSKIYSAILKEGPENWCEDKLVVVVAGCRKEKRGTVDIDKVYILHYMYIVKKQLCMKRGQMYKLFVDLRTLIDSLNQETKIKLNKIRWGRVWIFLYKGKVETRVST